MPDEGDPVPVHGAFGAVGIDDVHESGMVDGDVRGDQSSDKVGQARLSASHGSRDGVDRAEIEGEIHHVGRPSPIGMPHARATNP